MPIYPAIRQQSGIIIRNIIEEYEVWGLEMNVWEQTKKQYNWGMTQSKNVVPTDT